MGALVSGRRDDEGDRLNDDFEGEPPRRTECVFSLVDAEYRTNAPSFWRKEEMNALEHPQVKGAAALPGHRARGGDAWPGEREEPPGRPRQRHPGIEERPPAPRRGLTSGI